MKHAYYIISEKEIVPAYRIFGWHHAIEIAQTIAYRDASWASVHDVGILDGKEVSDIRVASINWNPHTEKVEITIKE